MISHVVFDFDGTLADSVTLALRLYNEVAPRRGWGAVTAENLAELRAASIAQRCERLGIPVYRVPAMVMEVGRHYRKIADTIPLFPGIPELLQGLRARGLRVSIVSTNQADTIRSVLRRHGLDELIGAVHCSSRMFGKARLLRRLMRETRHRPEELVYVGDEHRDLEASHEAGVRVIAVTWGGDAEQRLREGNPDAVAHRPEEIAEIVERWAAPVAEDRRDDRQRAGG